MYIIIQNNTFNLLQLHRRLLYDDNKGVSEPLDEIQFGEGLVTRGTHIVQLSGSENSIVQEPFPSTWGNDTVPSVSQQVIKKKSFGSGIKNHRLTAKSIITSLWISYSKTSMVAKDWFSTYKSQVSESLLLSYT